jgi:hydroxymethylpyrimidine/phosphomethylpyrimidine kinase
MKVVLTIAGSDSSGGAGIQADLKTIEAFGLFGASALTVLTAQNTTGVTEIQEISAPFVKAQIETVLKDFDVAAVKVGMLFSNEIIDIVRESIANLDVPIVVDPVFISKAGSKLLNDDAVENMKSLFEYATVITPNRYEAEALFGYKSSDVSSEMMLEKPFKIVVKNEMQESDKGHYSVDTLFNERKVTHFKSPSLETENTHGTGCSFSSAIASNLALGKSLEESIEVSKKFIYEGIKNAPNLGHGKGPIAHKLGAELCQTQNA